MKLIAAILGIVCVAAAQAAPVSVTRADACPEIRARISAQTGLLPKPDTALLEQLGRHPECRFSAAEVYRAAYGDQPLPKNGRRERHRKHHDGDD